MKRLPRGELEARVMSVLWDTGEWMTPGDVQAAITTARRPLAYTTVMTILVRLWKKGMLDRRLEGRAYVYRPVANRDAWAAQRMREVLDASGDPLMALNHFVDAISAKEATQLRRMLETRTKR